MSQKVDVLCPNGHRVPVKITPNTKVLQILEEACNKQGFHPTSDYELRHEIGKKCLDIGLSVRFAGIPNLAKLELVKASKARVETKVVIALQLPTGERIQGEFDPGTTIWHLLQYWENQPNSAYAGKLTQCGEKEDTPTCTYMREEVIGQYAMENTTLRSLGLTGGKAMLRLQHRNVNPVQIENIKSKIYQEKAKNERIAERASKFQEQQSQQKNDNPVNVKNCKGEMSKPASSSTNKIAENVSASSSRSSKEFESAFSVKSNSSEETMEAAQDEPMDTIYTSGTRPKAHGESEEKSQATRREQTVLLFFPSQETEPEVKLTSQQEAIAQSLAQAISPGMLEHKDTAERARLREERIRNRPPVPQMQPNFADFKFPEETKGQNLYQNEHSDVNKDEYKPCDRETVIYRLDKEKPVENGEDAMETDDVPDEFFEVTEKDVKNMWADTQREIKEIEEQPIMTKSMKLAAKEARMSHYERVVLRFVFPGQVAIQGLFRTKETVHAIHKFVKEYLEDKTQEFHLYTTPPRCILKDISSTLIEADLVPMSVVYFGSQCKKDNPISAAAMCELSTEAKAYEILVKYMPKPAPKQSSATSINSSKPSTSRNAASLSSGKVPKWFKIGKR